MSSTGTTYGVSEQTVSDSELAVHVEEIRLHGFSVLRGVEPDSEMPEVRDRLDEVYRRQIDEIGGVSQLEAMNDANIARLPMAYDPRFREFGAHPRLLELVRRLLGPFVVLQQQNGLINPPSGTNYQARWHRDLPYQHFVCSRPLAISTLWMLDPFNAETGGTWVLPASHKSESFPSAAWTERHQHQASGKPGDVLVFDSMLYHRAGTNRSGGLRRGLNQVYCLPMLAQQMSIPQAMPKGFEPTPEERRLLGYESAPAASVLEWRQLRLARGGRS